METLPTGISVLDRQFGGGLPSGSVVVLKANPDSQSELILDRFARVRRCRYLTTVRSADAVEAALSGDGDEETTVEATTEVGDLDEAAALTGDLPEAGTLIVDSVEPLEDGAAPAAYAEFLDDLRSRVDDAGGVALLHALRGGEDPRTRRVTEQVADVVFDLRTTVTGTEIANRLVVPKFRGGAALEEPLKLKLTDTVAVDTSRDIA
ncbi:transcriptional regulator [Halorubrum sp. SS5]|uniref:RAD55 family ATPase n=1 Tax=Halorubrum sp. SS7 TaxID=2518119 RepID=UPI0010F76094|nr:transcriptional regulator [Halorubrum sp. SS7]TKX60016.1 transcriptional regulator [Halorubrum sp. SS7]TKX87232.1 transcriptional regulator [Halorubrum sp. SS5]